MRVRWLPSRSNAKFLRPLARPLRRAPVKKRSNRPISSEIGKKWPVFTDELHPDALENPVVGLFKYTTGLLKSPHSSYSAVALKVYTEKPIDSGTWQSLGSTLMGNALTDRTGTHSLLGQLRKAAIKAHADVRTIRDFKCQVFGSQRACRSRLTASQRVVQYDGSWDILLSVHRAQGQSQVGTPMVQLQSPLFGLEHSNLKASHEPGGWPIRFRITAHLKPAICNVNDSTELANAESEGVDLPVGKMLQDAIMHMAAAIAEEPFRDANDTLLTLRSSLLQWLPRSHLASLTKMHHAEIVLSRAARSRRYVTNIKLNEDGSTQVAPVQEPVASTSGNAADNRKRLVPSPNLSVDYFEPPRSGDAAQTRDKVFAPLIYSAQSQSGQLEPIPERLVLEFRKQTEGSGATELLTCVSSSIRLAQQYPHVSGKVMIDAIVDSAKLLGDIAHPHFGVFLSLNDDQSKSDVLVRLPAMQIKPSGGKLDAPLATVYIGGTLLPHPSYEPSEPGVAIPYDAELERLANIGSVVLNTVWDELALSTYESAAQTLAKAVIRVIDFSSSQLAVHHVSVRLKNPDRDAPIRYYTGVAYAASHGDAHVTTSSEAASREQSTQEVSSNKREPSTPPLVDPDVGQRSNGTISYRTWKCSSAAVLDCLGLKSLEIQLEWDARRAKASERITARSIEEVVEEATLAHPDSGLEVLHILRCHLGSLGGTRVNVQLWAKTRTQAPNVMVTNASALSGALYLTVQSSGSDGPSKLTVRSKPGGPTVFAHMYSAKTSLSMTQLTEVLTSCVSSVSRDQHGKSAQALANAFAESLAQRQNELAECIYIKRAGLLLNDDDGILKSFWGRTAGSGNDGVHRPEDAALGTDSKSKSKPNSPGDILEDSEAALLTGGANIEADDGIADPQSYSPEETGLDNAGTLQDDSLKETALDCSKITSLPRPNDQAANDAAEIEGLKADPKLPILIALGSNVGDRLACIEEACRALEDEPDIRLTKTSSLYETKAMYVEDQAPFLNAVCEVETTLSPTELLDRTQAIEQRLGRVKTVDKGPRNIDLDVLLHGDTVMQTERLTIPHPLMLERHFVLRPMADMYDLKQLLHPVTGLSFRQHFNRLDRSDSEGYASLVLGEGCHTLRPSDPSQPTRVMAILNITPDSFSDGGNNTTDNLQALQELVVRHIANGARIIDVGGQSSRPNASDVTAEEEIGRVLPAIKAIKALPEAAGVAISVDTYRATVAEAAVEAGAHIVNDISAGLLDPDMLPTVARLGCTYIMMHMRGTPATMQDEEHCRYPDGVIPTITAELSARVDAAERAGVRRWRMILDPGLGFSKTPEQNLEILALMRVISEQCVGSLRKIPWLMGPSRKSFIGEATGVAEPKDRLFGTAAAVTAAVRLGAAIVRVHDVAEMSQVVKMTDAMHRTRGKATEP